MGNKTKIVNLKVPLAYIIGDIQGGDGICGHSAYYNSDAKRICRMCDATPDAYSSIEVDNCNLLVMSDVIHLCKNNMHKELDALMQARNWQAFYDIDYGGLPGGVFTAACPPEALHSLENGLINHCLKECSGNVIPTASHKHYDTIVQKWTLQAKQCHLKNYADQFPRSLFPDGVSSIKDISAGTKVGILFAIILAALTQDGKDVLLNEANISITKQSDMIEAFEMLLCYWAWLKKEEYWACHDMDALQRAKTAICKTVSQLLLLFPRTS